MNSPWTRTRPCSLGPVCQSLSCATILTNVDSGGRSSHWFFDALNQHGRLRLCLFFCHQLRWPRLICRQKQKWKTPQHWNRRAWATREAYITDLGHLCSGSKTGKNRPMFHNGSVCAWVAPTRQARVTKGVLPRQKAVTLDSKWFPADLTAF